MSYDLLRQMVTASLPKTDDKKSRKRNSKSTMAGKGGYYDLHRSTLKTYSPVINIWLSLDVVR